MRNQFLISSQRITPSRLWNAAMAFQAERLKIIGNLPPHCASVCFYCLPYYRALLALIIGVRCWYCSCCVIPSKAMNNVWRFFPHISTIVSRKENGLTEYSGKHQRKEIMGAGRQWHFSMMIDGSRIDEWRIRALGASFRFVLKRSGRWMDECCLSEVAGFTGKRTWRRIAIPSHHANRHRTQPGRNRI